MSTNHLKSTFALVPLFFFIALPSAWAQKFYPSDPMLKDNDRLVDVTQPPEEIELSDLYDRLGHIFVDFGDPEFSEAKNVNTLDEVPDSSWFTNRHGRTRMTLEELSRGANLDGPPKADETWMIVRGKTQGISPGFEIEDGKGDRYVVKFDPAGIPELSTSAEIIASKIFYALGYHVPQNYIVSYDPDKFDIQAGTMVKNRFGDKVPLTKFRLGAMLRRIPRGSDGKVRCIASKYIDGVSLGPFRYYGTRSDDPNDVIFHEHRRELRGLRLFAAWINHDDTRAQNTQSSWVQEGGQHYVRHWLLDFGSTFGSGTVDLQLANLSFHYWLSLDLVKKNAKGFGFHVPRYRKVKWPNFPEYESVGRWEGEAFDPLEWRNDYPNPAFVRMTTRDAFWAARILMKFTPEELAAIVEEGQLYDPAQSKYFYDVLLQRQQKCGRFGINGLNPVDEFRLVGDTLRFTNLSEEYGFASRGSTRYQIVWWKFNNGSGKKTGQVSAEVIQGETTTPVPMGPGLREQNLFLLVVIRSLNDDFPQWKQTVSVYLRPAGSGYQIVGIERDSPAEPIGMP